MSQFGRRRGEPPKMIVVSNHPNYLKQAIHAEKQMALYTEAARRMGHEVYQDCIIIKTIDEEPPVV